MKSIQWSRRDFLKFLSSSFLLSSGMRFCLPEAAEAAVGGNKLLVVFCDGGLDHLSLRVPLGGALGAYLKQVRPMLIDGQTFLPASEAGYGWHAKAPYFSELDLMGALAVVRGVAAEYSSGSHERASLYLAEGYGPGLVGGNYEPEISTKGIFGRMGDFRSLSASQRIGFGNQSSLFLRNAKYEPIITNTLANGGIHQSFLGNDNAHSFLSAVDAARYEALRAKDEAAQQAISASLEQLNILRNALGAYPAFNSTLSPQPRGSSWDTMFTDALFAFSQLQASMAVVSVGNFDSHGAQIPAYNFLFEQLSTALRCFYQNAVRIGLMQTLTIVIVTEFSRRVVQNGSTSTTGTDHGGAFDAIVISHPSRMNPGTYGKAIDLDSMKQNLIVPKSTDARDFFGTIGLDFGVGLSDLYPNRTGIKPLPIFKT